MLDYFQFYLLPLAIRVGMTPKQFWEDDPNLLWAYVSAYEQKVKDDVEYDNIKAYNQGLYVLLALRDSLQFGRTHKKIFPDAPIKQAKNRTNMTQAEYEEIRKIQLKNMVELFNKNKK